MNELQGPSGFGNQHASEALPGALPVGRNPGTQAPFANAFSSH